MLLGAKESILSSRDNERKLYKGLEDILYATDAEGAPPIAILGTKTYACRGMLVDYREVNGMSDPIFGMAGFATYDDIINSISVNGRDQRALFNKTSILTTAGNISSMWTAGGSPPGGSFGTALTGRSIDNTNAAALQFTNAGATRFKHAIGWGIGSTVGLGSIMLYDRVYEYPFTGSVTSGTFSVPTLVARDVAGATAGDGLMMWHENFSATATTAVTVTPTYTNSAGTGSRTNAYTSLVTAAVIGTVANPAGKFFLPLASGDTGVRSIQSYTLSATLTSANQTFVIGRPLGIVPHLSANAYIERDLVLQTASLPRLYDGTAMGLLILANTTTSPMFGEVHMSEN